LETESANLSAQRQEEQMRRRPVTTAATDYWTLALLLVLGLTGFWVEAARISVAPQPWDWTDPSAFNGPIFKAIGAASPTKRPL